MKPTIVKTSKSELCLVVVPDEVIDADVFSISPFEPMELGLSLENGMNITFTLPNGNWQLIGPLKDITEENPRPEDFGWYNSTSFDDTGGWMFEGGEDKYHEALDLWECRQAALSTGLKGNVIILKRTA